MGRTHLLPLRRSFALRHLPTPSSAPRQGKSQNFGCLSCTGSFFACTGRVFGEFAKNPHWKGVTPPFQCGPFKAKLHWKRPNLRRAKIFAQKSMRGGKTLTPRFCAAVAVCTRTARKRTRITCMCGLLAADQCVATDEHVTASNPPLNQRLGARGTRACVCRRVRTLSHALPAACGRATNHGGYSRPC